MHYDYRMARPYRLQGENCLYHIMSRGDDRKRVYTRPGDYHTFLDYVVKAKERYQFYLYAYCLLSNHFHLLIETRLPNISKIMHYIKGSYTTYYNVRHRRYGHLFQGRFTSIVVDKDSYFLELSRYIHLNPVRAGIVQDPAEYRWSSYRGYLGRKDEYIDDDQIRRFVLEGMKKRTDPLSNVYAGFLLGSVEFIRDKLKDLEVQITSDEVAHKRVLGDDAARSEDIIAAVTKYYKISIHELTQSTARPMRARQVLIYLLRKFTGLSNRTIGELVGMRHSAVSKAGLTIERLLEIDGSMIRTVQTIVSNFEG